MKEVRFLTALALLVLASFLASAYDPSPLQDFCVGIPEPNGVFVNGKFCKDPKLVTANDFYLQAGLNTPANAAANKYGFAVKLVLVDQLPGLNTLGISVVRADWVPGGETPPHSHPRATEIMVVLEGTVLAGFVASNDNNNTLFAKVLNPGDVFVFPIGQIHFQANVGKVNASALVGFNSQNPGVITIADTVFGSKPHINTDILAKAFQVNADVIKELEKQFG